MGSDHFLLAASLTVKLSRDYFARRDHAGRVDMNAFSQERFATEVAEDIRAAAARSLLIVKFTHNAYLYLQTSAADVASNHTANHLSKYH